MAMGLKLVDYTTMSEKDFDAIMQRMDWDAWKEDPTKAMLDAGVKLKEGVTFKLINNDKELQSLPAGVIPLQIIERGGKEYIAETANISGGSQRGITIVDVAKWQKNH